MAVRGLGRLNWADTAPMRFASGRTEREPKPPFQCEPKIGFTPFADLRESVPLHKECAGLRPSRRGKARLWDTTPSSVIPLLPAPGCCASWRPGSPCRLHGPDADAGATLVVGSHESRETALPRGEIGARSQQTLGKRKGRAVD